MEIKDERLAKAKKSARRSSVQPSVALRAMEGILRALRAFFADAKKSTDGKPDGLPSVASAKDGGAEGSRTLDLYDANVSL